jgi:hypothetical protein
MADGTRFSHINDPIRTKFFSEDQCSLKNESLSQKLINHSKKLTVARKSLVNKAILLMSR